MYKRIQNSLRLSHDVKSCRLFFVQAEKAVGCNGSAEAMAI